MKKKSLPQLFIIESLKIQDEEEHRQEGDIVSRMLNLSGKPDTIYFYIRTSHELSRIVDRFSSSNYRYLHISCHADALGMATTFDTIDNRELSDIMEDRLYRTRLFVSACEMANDDLARHLFRKTRILSFAGPTEPIDFGDAAAFWVSFYHLMFKKDDGSMEGRHVKEVLNKLSALYDVQMSLFVRKKNRQEYSTYTFPNKYKGTPRHVTP